MVTTFERSQIGYSLLPGYYIALWPMVTTYESSQRGYSLLPGYYIALWPMVITFERSQRGYSLLPGYYIALWPLVTTFERSQRGYLQGLGCFYIALWSMDKTFQRLQRDYLWLLGCYRKLWPMATTFWKVLESLFAAISAQIGPWIRKWESEEFFRTFSGTQDHTHKYIYIEYIYWVYWRLYGEDYLPLTHMLSSFPRKSSYKVVCMMYKCKNDWLYIYVW